MRGSLAGTALLATLHEAGSGTVLAQAPADGGTARTPAVERAEAALDRGPPEPGPSPSDVDGAHDEADLGAAEDEPGWPRFELGLRAEIEFVNVEGPGGFSHRPTTPIAPARRAPYVQLDKATVDLISVVAPWLLARVELRLEGDEASADRVYLESPVELPFLDGRLLLQVGRQKPMQRPPDRRAETYSPQGKVFWRGREWHAAARIGVGLGPLRLFGIGSAAMQRELSDEAIGEDDALPTIAFGHTETLEDSGVELGGLLGVSAFGATLGGFFFEGELLDLDSRNRLERTFDYDCRGTPCYELLGDVGDRSSRWYGGRAWFERWGIFVLGEVIHQTLGRMEREAFELGGSYTFAFTLLEQAMEVEPLVRYGRLDITNLPHDFRTPESWDREQWLLALLLRPLDQLEIKVEYLLLREQTGVSVEGTTGVDDDQLLIQLRFEESVDL